MATWKNININRQNIETETGRATLIKMPHNSNYDGYKFWHPSKCVRSGRNRNAVSIGYTDEFTFTLKKFGNGKYNKFDVIYEIVIGVEEFEEAFGVMNENITSQLLKNEYETHVPNEVQAQDIDALEELKDE